MEYGSIEREIYVDASPDVVFEVVSSPEHISEWWTDDAEVAATPGAVGELVWGDRAEVVPITVVNADPPRLFSFRWCCPEGKVGDSADSLLATFVLTPSGAGTRIRLTGSGFGEMGWEAAKLEEQYREHSSAGTPLFPDSARTSRGSCQPTRRRMLETSRRARPRRPGARHACMVREALPGGRGPTSPRGQRPRRRPQTRRRAPIPLRGRGIRYEGPRA
ncbi:SRPBCC family protein [Streptomyces sp. NPDC001634]|uniref:SRPBCC family protein n=1 Tax=Streptomyces sp. NPDC001634 TaxID=3154390 RepID=UPI00331E3A92